MELIEQHIQRLCRRFCHCVSILRSLDRCTLEYADPNHPRALHIVIGFICQVSRTASSIFVQIFDQVRLCCFARRPRQPTAKHMFTLTDHLGEMCKEIKCLSETLEHSDTVSVAWLALENAADFSSHLFSMAFSSTQTQHSNISKILREAFELNHSILHDDQRH